MGEAADPPQSAIRALDSFLGMIFSENRFALFRIMPRRNVMADHFDVLIIGGGLSGVGAAYHLQTKCPSKSFVILEARDAIGGTWDLFRYPGIRSDSDMFTLGYSFKPWTDPKAIADGPRILNYVRETAAENGIDRKIRYRHRVKRASWSTKEARWKVEAEHTS